MSDGFANVVPMDALRALQAGLATGSDGDDALRLRLEENLTFLERFASTWQTFAMERAPGLRRVVPTREPVDISPLILTPSSRLPTPGPHPLMNS